MKKCQAFEDGDVFFCFFLESGFLDLAAFLAWGLLISSPFGIVLAPWLLRLLGFCSFSQLLRVV
jgi:hypothetical protein